MGPTSVAWCTIDSLGLNSGEYYLFLNKKSRLLQMNHEQKYALMDVKYTLMDVENALIDVEYTLIDVEYAWNDFQNMQNLIFLAFKEHLFGIICLPLHNHNNKPKTFTDNLNGREQNQE